MLPLESRFRDLVLVSLLLPATLLARQHPPERDRSIPVRQSFHVEVLFPPEVVRLADTTRLVYELHLTNFARTPLAPRRLLILEAESGRMIHQLDATSLAAALALAGGSPRGQDSLLVAPGMRAVVYLSLPIAKPPRRLRHRIHFDAVGEENGKTAIVEAGETQVSTRVTPRLGPPLRGGPWVAVYDPQLERGHRRVLYAVDGRARIPGRFAIDWMRPLGSGGAGDASGAEVLAVADAIVAATRDDVPEPLFAHRRGPMALGDATGNYIALDLGGGVYAFYEHLRPGILVRRGDRVRRGQVIGALGSTGQATQPHLHFHVSDALSPLGAEGLPFTIENVEVLGAYASMEAFGRGGKWGDRPAGGTVAPDAIFPSPNMVVAFRP
jgi:murein DD-endopeptidase